MATPATRQMWARIRPQASTFSYYAKHSRGVVLLTSKNSTYARIDKPTLPSSHRTPLQALAARITTHADALAAATRGLAQASHSLKPSLDGPNNLLPEDAPVTAQAEQLALRDALAEAQILVTDATEFVHELAIGNNQFACVRWLCHFNIPLLLPLPVETQMETAGTPMHTIGATSRQPCYPTKSYASVAKAAGVPEHQLRSIARMAMLKGFLSEPESDYVCHSPLSAAMAAKPQLLEWTQFVTSSSAPMVTAMVEATERWGEDRAAHRTAYAVAWATDLTVFGHVAADPDRQARWASYMRAMTQSEGMKLSHLVEGWRSGWHDKAASSAVVVDVGGSAGHVSIALARAFPGLRFVVQDRGEVVQRALAENAPALAQEGLPVTFQVHDFFTPQPARPPSWEDRGMGDVYLLRQILHDWGDDEAIQILRHLAAALEKSGPEARLVIMDTILPSPGAGSSRTEEARLRVRDLTMLQAHNAHERSESEWRVLLQRAHPALKINRIVQPFKSLMAILDIGFDTKE
ncbi:hypothetical protein G7054_g13912 [Neopestalotiopsis clavispora]|nr:hypothetical protein G7054_g13912 [Neopestalotiopsis clavispora]